MEPRDHQRRYLIRFADGGAGMRHRDEPLASGDEIEDGGVRYVITSVEQPGHKQGLGHADAEPIYDAV